MTTQRFRCYYVCRRCGIQYTKLNTGPIRVSVCPRRGFCHSVNFPVREVKDFEDTIAYFKVLIIY